MFGVTRAGQLKEIGMTSLAARGLTDRQRAVMERIDRRVPIKVIAQELGVSETRINQHIRALKDIYDAGNLGDLVENYRAVHRDSRVELPQPRSRDPLPFVAPALSQPVAPASSAAQPPRTFLLVEAWARDETGSIMLGDARTFVPSENQSEPDEPQLVPKLLEGEHAVPFRLLAILSIAACILATVILSVNAAVVLSDVVEDKAALSARDWTAPVQTAATSGCYPACGRPR